MFFHKAKEIGKDGIKTGTKRRNDRKTKNIHLKHTPLLFLFCSVLNRVCCYSLILIVFNSKSSEKPFYNNNGISFPIYWQSSVLFILQALVLLPGTLPTERSWCAVRLTAACFLDWLCSQPLSCNPMNNPRRFANSLSYALYVFIGVH